MYMLFTMYMTKKARKDIQAFKEKTALGGIRTHDILYRCSTNWATRAAQLAESESSMYTSIL